MATLLSQCRLGMPRVAQPSLARVKKVAVVWHVAKLTASKTASMSLVASAAAVMAPTVPSPADAASARPTLYLLHRHMPHTSDTEYTVSQEQLQKLRDDLKAMEKVAKRAAWFSAVEASDGEHVLLLTDCAKLGSKYELQRMPADASSFTLELPGRSVVVPLGDVTASLLANAVRSEEASSDEEKKAMTPGSVQAAAMTAVMDDAKAAKKARKEEAKAVKAKAKMETKSAEMDSDKDSDKDSDEEEDEKEHKMVKEKDKKKETDEKKKEKDMVKGMKDMPEGAGESGSDSEDDVMEGGKTEVKMGGKEKEEKKKDKKEKKEEEKEEKKDKKGAEAKMRMEEEEESGGESSGGESSDEEMAPDGKKGEAAGPMGAAVKPMAMEDEESSSDSGSESESGSESDSEGDAPPMVTPGTVATIPASLEA